MSSEHFTGEANRRFKAVSSGPLPRSSAAYVSRLTSTLRRYTALGVDKMYLAKLARVVLLTAVSSLPLAACASSVAPVATVPPPSATIAQPPTLAGELVTQADQVVGIWQVDDPHCQKGFMLVRPDGSYTLSCHQDGSDGVSGKYSLENGRFLIQNDYCQGRQYEARSLQGNGQPRTLVFVIVKDDCPTIEDHLTKQPALWLAALP
jgi:hypothetical protein